MSLISWARANDPAGDEARRRIAALPASDKQGRVRVPFPRADKQDYKSQFSNDELKSLIEGAPERDVPIKGLHAIQDSVGTERTQEYVRHPDAVPPGMRSGVHGGKVDLPVVMKFGDKLYLHDGHHRATAAWAQNDKTIHARLVDLDSVVRA